MFDYESLFNDIEADDFDNETDSEDVLGPGTARLCDMEVGDQFRIGEERFIILENDLEQGIVKVIRRDFLPSARIFGGSADWKSSPIRSELNGTYCGQLAELVGRDNIIPITRDLTSLDGLDDYGSCVDQVSLLTASEYAKFHRILGVGSRYSNWWWLITPASTPSNGYSRYVCCVNSSGILLWCGCGYCNGVRPFCVLNSSILVSCEVE